jgi:hypothetical protein
VGQELPAQSDETGMVAQQFEYASIELHPENPAPWNGDRDSAMSSGYEPFAAACLL